MDRLVFGDVGFGKTEVALRAAFKAVQDGQQAAVLVPTTLLAQQHLATFEERLAPYPIRVEMLSRFLTSAEQRGVVAELAAGSVDIVIGTHRLLSEDVDLQGPRAAGGRRGAAVRGGGQGQLKAIRTSVDVLTLTATPIPRTLEMALTGIREVSRIAPRPRIVTRSSPTSARTTSRPCRRRSGVRCCARARCSTSTTGSSRSTTPSSVSAAWSPMPATPSPTAG